MLTGSPCSGFWPRFADICRLFLREKPTPSKVSRGMPLYFRSQSLYPTSVSFCRLPGWSLGSKMVGDYSPTVAVQ